MEEKTTTAQYTDQVIFRGEYYSLIGIKGGELISPKQFGMEPVMISTACYRGYIAEYELTNEALCLRKLILRADQRRYLPITGVLPIEDNERLTATYTGLRVIVPFVGKLRLARDFIDKLYIHMGFQKASAFKTVLDITLDCGKVVSITDRSREMEEKRGAFKKHYHSNHKIDSIKEAFSLDMDLE